MENDALVNILPLRETLKVNGMIAEDQEAPIKQTFFLRLLLDQQQECNIFVRAPFSKNAFVRLNRSPTSSKNSREFQDILISVFHYRN